jgi:hypothetical protein
LIIDWGGGVRARGGLWSMVGLVTWCRIGVRQIFNIQKGTFYVTEWIDLELIEILFIREREDSLAHYTTAYVSNQWAFSSAAVGVLIHEGVVIQ